MADVSPELVARFDAELSLMAAALSEEDFSTELIEPQEGLPVPTLLVALGADDGDRERTLGITILPFDEGSLSATGLVQFYVRLPFNVPTSRRQDVAAATAMVNAAMAIGHFAVRGEELYYRYVLAVPTDATIDDEMLLELVALIAFHQENFSDFLEGVLDDEISLSILPDLLAQA